MKISRSVGYALVAVGCIAQSSDNGPVLAAKISKECDIPLEYLLKILQQLVKANLLHSKRGPRGGFYLAKSAKDITMLDIIKAIDGPLHRPFRLVEQMRNAIFSTKMEGVCEEAGNATEHIYGRATIEKMIE